MLKATAGEAEVLRLRQSIESQMRRNTARLVPVAVPAARASSLVAARAQRLGQLFLQHQLDGFEDSTTHLRLDTLA